MPEDHGCLSFLSFLCVHTSAVCSLPGREPGATFQAVGGAPPSAQGAQSQNRAETVAASFVHIPAQVECSALTTAFPGEEMVFWHLDVSAACMWDPSATRRADRDVSLTEMQRHNFKRLRLQLNMPNSRFY